MGGDYYTTKAGDMWDYIAWVVYGDEKQMEMLLQAEENALLIENYIFSAGVKVWCPEIVGKSAAENLPPWRSIE